MAGREIGRLLKQKGVINSVESFRWAIWFKGAEQDLRMGTIALAPPLTRENLVEKLQQKNPLQRWVVLKEGWPSWKITSHLAEKLNLPRERFEAFVNNKKFLDRLELPGSSLEGYLFPETYLISADASPENVIKQLIQQFDRVSDKINLPQQAEEVGLNLHQAVILASIIERETALPEERVVVSAVFHNRLQKGMPLEADPTVLYAHKDFQRSLTLTDLRIDSPYNTYKNRGLPPGPICNPGKASLQAAVNPADTSVLYFVARPDGSHKFSKSYSTHQKAVRKYQ